MAASRYADLRLYGRLLCQSRPYWLYILVLFLLSLLSTPLALLTPLPLKIVVDSVIGSQPMPRPMELILSAVATNTSTSRLVLAAVLLIAIPLFNELLGAAGSLLRTYTGEKLVMDFRTHLFGHVQRLSLSYHDMRGTSDSVYRIQYDAPAIVYIVIDGVGPFITSILTLAGMIYITVRLDWQLALIALAVSPAFILFGRSYRLRLRKQSRELKKFDSFSLSVVQEALAAIRVVKAFGREEREQERFVKHSSAGIRARLRMTLIESGFGILLSLTTIVGTAAVVLIGTVHVKSGALTLGELLLIMGYLSQLYIPLTTISKRVVSMQSHLASAERAFALLDEEPDVFERLNARSLARASGAVSFRSVSFGYDTGRPVLQDVSLEVNAGTRVGIAGRTGAGKTTLVALLTRFYDPTAGRILLDGIDLRDYRLADLRNQYSIVLQEPVLFSTSIAENIAYARPTATDEEIVEAAKAANAHDFIISLPQGYESQVGERGMQLSGGERQRISLARAFLKDAPVLILDEPTSSVDLKTEAVILEALERLVRGRTTFMIAHRLSTLANCSVLLEIEDGRLVKQQVGSTAD